MKYGKYKPTRKQFMLLRDSATALQYGRLHNDRRLQVTMPSAIVDLLDQTFPKVERNKVITQAVIAMISQTLLTDYKTNPTKLLQQDQHEMNEMWDFLNELDQGKI